MKMRFMLKILPAIVLSCTPALAESGSLPLVRDGKPVAAIILADSTSLRDSSVLTLVSHIEQMSGATLPIFYEGEIGPVEIKDGKITVPPEKSTAETFLLLGESNLSKQLGVSLEGLAPGGVILKSQGNAIMVMGRIDNILTDDPSLNPHPVFRFLENLGCRYLWPGELGKVIPKRPNLVVEPLDYHYTPKIGQRRIRMMPGGNRGYDKGLAILGIPESDALKIYETAIETSAPANWMTWNGLGGELGVQGGHGGYGLLDAWEKYGRERPEWFARQTNGSRDQSGVAERWTLCTSNPSLIEHVSNEIIARLNGKATTPISLAPNDGGYSGPCMCDECKKLDAPDGPKISLRLFEYAGSKESTNVDYVSLTDRYVTYWNEIAKRVNKAVPDQLFIIDAYSYYSDPPVREKLSPNLIVRYVPSGVEGWSGWQKAGAKKIFWRPNNLHGNHQYGVIKPAAKQTAETMKILADGGMFATDMQGIYNNWATQGLEYYVAARFDWDPDQDFNAVVDDYCRSGFGAGADTVKEYFQVMEKDCILVSDTLDAMGRFMSLDTEKRLRALLEKAEVATKDDPDANRRVKFLRVGLEFSSISAEAYRLGDLAAQGKQVNQNAARKLLDRRWRMMRNIALKENLAINTALVAVGDAATPLRLLDWTAPQGAEPPPVEDNWLFEDQSDMRKSK